MSGSHVARLLHRSKSGSRAGRRAECRLGRIAVQDGVPIHIAVVGYKSNKNGLTGEREVDKYFCRILLDAVPQRGCDASADAAISLAFHNDERIGTEEFDLVPNVVGCPLNHLGAPCYFYTGTFGGGNGSISATAATVADPTSA